MWYMESPAYPFGWHGNHYIDFFNWTMTYRYDADFYHPYGRVYNTKPHPTEEKKLDSYIEEFGRKNAHMANGKTKKVNTVEKWVKKLGFF